MTELLQPLDSPISACPAFNLTTFLKKTCVSSLWEKQEQEDQLLKLWIGRQSFLEGEKAQARQRQTVLKMNGASALHICSKQVLMHLGPQMNASPNVFPRSTPSILEAKVRSVLVNVCLAALTQVMILCRELSYELC